MPPVYDVVLLPPDPVSRTSIETSERMRELGTRFTLKDTDAVPHVSLYMLNIRERDLGRAQDALAELAERTPAIPLEAESFAANEHGMTEVFYRKTPKITQLQQDVLETVGPLRDGLRELDPVGRSVPERMRQASDELARNFNVYGYDEIGSHFNPHITLTRLSDPSRRPAQPDLSKFDGRFERLALFRMGEHGTCVEKVGEWRVGARATAKDGPSGRTPGRQAPRLAREQRESPRAGAARQPER